MSFFSDLFLQIRNSLHCILLSLFCFQASFSVPSKNRYQRTIPYPLIFALIPDSFLVGTNGLEPSTSRLSGVRSNHLSYAPLMEMRRIELLTPCLQSRCSPS